MSKFLLLPFIYLCFAHLTEGQGGNGDTSKTFSCQVFGQRSSVTLRFSGGNIIGRRNLERIPSHIFETSIFIEGNFEVYPFTDGSFQVSPRDSDVWFIPMELGYDPFKIEPGYCIRLICPIRPGYHDVCPDCEILNQFDRITVIGGIDAMCERSCLCSVVFAFCDSILPYDYFGGGIIVKAKKVKISDPEWYWHNPGSDPITFMIDDNGNMTIMPYKRPRD